MKLRPRKVLPLRLQQYLPFTVLKRILNDAFNRFTSLYCCNSTYRLRYWNVFRGVCVLHCVVGVATVLTVYGIETFSPSSSFLAFSSVATVLTVYGIETVINKRIVFFLLFRLQQYLPFTVLKRHRHCEGSVLFYTSCNSTYRLRYWNHKNNLSQYLQNHLQLQQYLPFTVLKPNEVIFEERMVHVATVLTVYGIETITKLLSIFFQLMLQQYLPFTVLKL